MALTLFFFLIFPVSSQQTCLVQLPNNQYWTGKIVKKSYQGDDLISILKQDNGSYLISDFSAGLFQQMGFDTNNPMVISIDCENNVTGSSFDTRFGQCVITGGSWDPGSKRLTIDWKIPANYVDETTVFFIP